MDPLRYDSFNRTIGLGALQIQFIPYTITSPKDREKEMKNMLKVINLRLRAVGGEVILRNKRYTKGSQHIKTQFPGAKADFEDLTVVALRQSGLDSYTSQWLAWI